MRYALYMYLFNQRENTFYVDSCWSKQNVYWLCAEFGIELFENGNILAEKLSHKRISVGMYTSIWVSAWSYALPKAT